MKKLLKMVSDWSDRDPVMAFSTLVVVIAAGFALRATWCIMATPAPFHQTRAVARVTMDEDDWQEMVVGETVTTPVPAQKFDGRSQVEADGETGTLRVSVSVYKDLSSRTRRNPLRRKELRR